MLSRVADSLYWIGRNVERAENLARLVDVNLQMLLDLPGAEADRIRSDWGPLLDCLDALQLFDKRGVRPECEAATEFLVFDPSNPNSILNCLRLARENARAIREQISTELWEQINRAYLWSITPDARQMFQRNAYEFFWKIKEECYLFHGVAAATMPRDDAWFFLSLGIYLERAEKTSRFLDDKFHLLEKSSELLQWSSVLRSCSARQAYQKIYVADVEPPRVAELLLLNERFPRSVLFCLQHADVSLRRISGVGEGRFSNEAEKIVGRVLARFLFSDIEELTADGLHALADAIQSELNLVGAAIYKTYISYSHTEAGEASASSSL